MAARLQGKIGAMRGETSPNAAPPLGTEADLQEYIAAECRRRGWFFVRSRMDLPSTTIPGTPDFVIAANDGRTFWIECKTKTGKLSPAQAGVAMMLSQCGHKCLLVRSPADFHEHVDR